MLNHTYILMLSFLLAGFCQAEKIQIKESFSKNTGLWKRVDESSQLTIRNKQALLKGSVKLDAPFGVSKKASFRSSIRFQAPLKPAKWSSLSLTYKGKGEGQSASYIIFNNPKFGNSASLRATDNKELKVSLTPGKWYEISTTLKKGRLKMSLLSDRNKLIKSVVSPINCGKSIEAVGLRSFAAEVLIDDFVIEGKVAKAQNVERLVPQPVFEKNPAYVDLYYEAWKQAYTHLDDKKGMVQTPYMDEAFDGNNIWIWDTCFMVLFCRYAPDSFPGIESLNNFYKPMHAGAKLPINIHILDNPPLFAWAEYEYYKLTGDKTHIKQLINKDQYLQKHFKWFDTVRPGYKLPHSPTGAVTWLKRVKYGYHWEGGRSGMDNTPRGRRNGVKSRRQRPNNPKMLWVDAIAQQGLSALYIAELSKKIGNHSEAEKWQKEYDKLKKIVNDYYWDDKDGIYYDINVDTLKPMKLKTPASYWPMLAGMCSKKQAKRMAKHITDEKTFGGLVPWPTVARDDVDFVADYGDYWRGGVWLPTAYMGTKALEKYGFYKEADEAAEKLLAHMLKTYQTYKPATIWECYSPTKAEPAKHGRHRVRPDFCGWSALGPISMFIENVLGFHHINTRAKRIEWRLHQKGRHGIKKLRFGKIKTDILTDGKGKVSVKSNRPYKLLINGKAYAVKKGNNTFLL